MQILICLTLLAFAQARVINVTSNCIVVHNINHEKEVLKEGIDGPYQLSIDYDTNTLFFSYGEGDVFKSAYISLKTNDFGTISGIPGGFASAVDGRNHIVYLGGHKGIYTFDFDSKKAKYLDGYKNIWQMFFKDKLYYTDYPFETAYFYKNASSQKVPELIDTRARLLAIDNNQNIFFANSTGLFSNMKDEGEPVLIGDYVVNGFTSDRNGNIYFSTPDGIYSLNQNGQQIDRLVVLENIYGLAIEGDSNIIYSDQNSVIRLKPTKTNCF